jgi:site-specific DNA-methyltransferase (adenine-specific)
MMSAPSHAVLTCPPDERPDGWAENTFAGLLPGANLVALTHLGAWHRFAIEVEDAGFTVFDSIAWIREGGSITPIVLARKPAGGTFAANVLRHGVGGLNVGACRIGGGPSTVGRWPADVMFTHAVGCTPGSCVPSCPVAALDTQSGILTSGANPTRRGGDMFRAVYHPFAGQRELTPSRGAERGGASRFFWTGPDDTGTPPLALLRELARLTTPRGGTIWDPFPSEAPTRQAAESEGMAWRGGFA